MTKKIEMQKKYLDEFGKSLVPKKLRPDLREYLAKAGYPQVPYSFFGILFFIGIIITAIIFFASGFAKIIIQQPIILQGLYVFLFWIIISSLIVSIIMAGFYFTTNMSIYNRVKEIEAQLPEYLTLVSTNLKGGLSFEKSLWGAIKPDFKILGEEMSIVSKKVMTGEEITDALTALAQKYDSPTLKRTMDIILGEIETGGQVAHVLDQIIENLRKTKIIKDEMSANTLLFTIFIAAIVAVISPMLFALAKVLLGILIDVSKQVAPAMSSAKGASSGFKIKEITMSITTFRNFSIGALSVISIFASMILSIIQKGEIRAGIKYIPFFLATAIIFYFIFSISLGGFFTI
ncbi:type II secretion system F family protein [Candidatus Woesearchaeota archaeon]|nr:type II secretion system F family protein [Candidatus Woesearchaeota archaeon]MCF7900977.1 type II secretion system F family protein [Candidatus Woesearchaeota archaeon]MCF8013307.1 type II secretion system F family protein [Candidatus Woesearchaeota archaeon]